MIWSYSFCMYTRGVHIIVSLMAHHTAWLLGARGNCGEFFYDRMKFRSNPFSVSKVIKCSSWFSHIHSKVKAHYEKRRPATGLRGLCLIHDNAPARKCVLVQDFLKEEKVVQLSHPPYSPDLSPCDFFLFPLLKKTFLVVVMNPEVHLVVQFTGVLRVYLKRPTFLP